MKHAHFVRPGRNNRIVWITIYSLLIIAVVLVAYGLANSIRTRSLPSGKVTLSVPYTKYLTTDEITFTLTNNFNSTIYVPNQCPTEPLGVYRLENNTWVRIHANASLTDCPDEERQIAVPANGSVSGSFKPWQSLFAKPGKYRVVAFVEYYNSLPYQDFEVIEKPVPPTVPPPTTTTSQSAPQRSSTSNSTTQTQTSPTNSTTATRQRKTITTAMGTVVVEYTSSTIYVISITPASGYTYEGGRSGPQVEITFKKAGAETQLRLTLNNGQLVQQVIAGGD